MDDESRRLDVFLSSRLCGELLQSKRGATYSFQYTSNWIAGGGEPLSRSLPLGTERFEHEACQPFFGGLLPEGQARVAVARELRLSEDNDFALLRELGGECAGAVSLFPHGVDPPGAVERPELEWLEDAELAQKLRELAAHPLLTTGGGAVRLSLAGAQAKVPLYSDGERFAIPLNAAPTTHILKIPIRELEDTVVNECVCLKAARLAGIDVPDAKVVRAESFPFLVVERYDRERDGAGNVVRVHQEDFCQALGLGPNRKYEAEGGPSVAAATGLIRAAAAVPARGLIAFMETIVFNFLVGNGDAHGKNYSLLYTQAGTALAPSYDLISTGVYERLETKLAMRIGGEYRPTWVKRRHWERFVDEAGINRRFLRRAVELARRVPDAVAAARADLAQTGFESPVLDRLEALVAARAEAVVSELG